MRQALAGAGAFGRALKDGPSRAPIDNWDRGKAALKQKNAKAARRMVYLKHVKEDDGMEELLSIISLNWPSAICILIGFGLVIVEMFVPGFGVPGITGLALLLVGVVLAANSVLEAILLAIIIVVLLCLILSLSLRSASKGRLAKTPLVLSDSATKEEGYSSAEDMSYFLGRQGVAQTPLRPAGMADFDGVRLDVVSDGEFVPKGTKLVITKWRAAASW